MSDPFIAEIKIFAGNFAPRGWAFCDGQLLEISQNTALFSLIGTTYGGDGRTTTALPNLRDRAPMHAGNGPGLTMRRLGANGGVATVTLTPTQIPPHTHQGRVVEEDATQADPANNALGIADENVYTDAGTSVPMGPNAIGNTGGGGPHQNRQPYLGLYFIIALVGTFPSRN